MTGQGFEKIADHFVVIPARLQKRIESHLPFRIQPLFLLAQTAGIFQDLSFVALDDGS